MAPRRTKKPRNNDISNSDCIAIDHDADTNSDNPDNPVNPVIAIVQGSSTSSLDIHDSNFFQHMIHPLTSEDMLSRIFRRTALCVRNQPSHVTDIIQQHMFDLEVKELFENTSSDHIFVWLTQPNDGKIVSVELNAEQALPLAHHHATYCRAPPTVEQPMVARLLQGTGMGCGGYDPSGSSHTTLGRGEVEVFIGTNQHKTGWHYDFQENFTLQLSGSKKWTLQSSTIQYPLLGCTPHYASPGTVESQLKATHLSDPTFQFTAPPNENNSVGPKQSVTLTTGDMLYFPAGMWHTVETIEPGVSINISLMATNYATLTAQAIQHLLLKDDAWRETIMYRHTSSGGTALEHLKGLLHKLPNKIHELIQQGGAEAILPPALRYPTKMVPIDAKDDDEWNDMEDDDDEFDEEEQHDENDNNDDTVKSSDNDAKHDNRLSNMFSCLVVDVSSFEPPQDWIVGRWDPDTPYIRNPLAHLVSMNQVTQYYNLNSESTVSDNYWLLNVNYAGNEVHESSIRVIIKTNGTNPLNVMQEKEYETFSTKMNCYLYHGLYIPTGRQ